MDMLDSVEQSSISRQRRTHRIFQSESTLLGVEGNQKADTSAKEDGGVGKNWL
jgi:hypothetical protein